MAGKALFITSNTGIEHDELIKPFEFLQSKGIEAIHAAIEQSEVQTVKHDKTLGPTYTPLTSLDKIDPADYDILVIPGGQSTPINYVSMKMQNKLFNTLQITQNPLQPFVMRLGY